MSDVLTEDEVARFLEEGLDHSEPRSESAILAAVDELADTKIDHVLWTMWKQERVRLKIGEDGQLLWKNGDAVRAEQDG